MINAICYYLMKVLVLLGILLLCLLFPLSLIGTWSFNTIFNDKRGYEPLTYKECLPILDNSEGIILASSVAVIILPFAIVKAIFTLPVMLWNECSKRASEYEKLKEVKK
jgi:hypothetical protein